MPEPAFLGVGAHLGGTVWWRGLLAQHPGVDLRPVAHGDDDTFFEPFCTREMTDADVAAYHERFTGSGLNGEWSDRFMYHAWMLPLLRRAAPDAKLIAMVRDPVERYRSVLGYRLGARDDDVIHMTEAFHRGRYAAQLRTMERFFPTERTLVLQYERCVADPRGEYRRMLEFLDLDPAFVPRGIDRGPRPRFALLRRLLRRPVGVEVQLWPELEAALRTAYADDARALGDRVDLSLWPGVAGG